MGHPVGQCHVPRAPQRHERRNAAHTYAITVPSLDVRNLSRGNFHIVHICENPNWDLAFNTPVKWWRC